MGHALIWIESLAATLVFVALVTAVAAHWQRLGRWTVPIVVAVGLVAFAVAATVFICLLHLRVDNHPISNPQSFAALGWTSILAVGSVILLVKGLRRTELVPAARAWPRSKLAVAFGALVVVTAITFSNMDLAVKIQLAALRAEAGAKTMAILPPRLPDAENAALVYQEAFELLVPPEPVPPQWRNKADHWLEYDRALFEPKDPELREFMHTQERGLALLRKAAAMPGCSFVRDYSRGFEMPLPELLRMREAVKLLAYEALIRAEDGDAHGALADVAAIYGVIGHINDPLLISGVAAASAEKIAAKSLEDVLSLTSPTAADLAQVTMPDRPHRRALRSGLAGEEAVSLASFEAFAYPVGDGAVLRELSPDLGRTRTWALMSPYYRLYLLSDDLVAYRRMMGDLQRIANQPYADSRQGLDALRKFSAANHGGLVARLLVPNIDKCVERAWEADARRSLARTALALAMVKAKTGSYPDKLDAVAAYVLPRPPLDPYTGRPIRIKRDGTGVLIYSVGPDLKDDGGRPIEPGKSDGDLIFRLR
jgi:hypothetical protein